MDPYVVIVAVASAFAVIFLLDSWRFARRRQEEALVASERDGVAPKVVPPWLAVSATLVSIATIGVTGFWWLMLLVGMAMDDRSPEEATGFSVFPIYLVAVLSGLACWILIGAFSRRSVRLGSRHRVVAAMVLWPTTQFAIQALGLMALNAAW